ncbi:MAG TPA: DUF892 family protein [Candidatus Paceibacterota bacterium]|nr:DUF892 family protein [Candidatus Paceibacterota bacterium]
MKLTKSKFRSLEDLFVMELQYLYDMESEIIKALPKVIKKATDPDLEESLTAHLEETKMQAKRLEQAFSQIGEKPKKTKSAAVRGLIADGEDIMGEDPASEILDAGIVATCRDIEHFEMAEYMTAIAWAEALGHEGVVELLQESLEEERGGDMKLAKGSAAIIERAQESFIGEKEDEG